MVFPLLQNKVQYDVPHPWTQLMRNKELVSLDLHTAADTISVLAMWDTWLIRSKALVDDAVTGIGRRQRMAEGAVHDQLSQWKVITKPRRPTLCATTSSAACPVPTLNPTILTSARVTFRMEKVTKTTWGKTGRSELTSLWDQILALTSVVVLGDLRPWFPLAWKRQVG